MVNFCLILIGVSVVALVHIALSQQSVVGNETGYKIHIKYHTLVKHVFKVVYVSLKYNSDFSNQESLV